MKPGAVHGSRLYGALRDCQKPALGVLSDSPKLREGVQNETEVRPLSQTPSGNTRASVLLNRGKRGLHIRKTKAAVPA